MRWAEASSGFRQSAAAPHRVSVTGPVGVGAIVHSVGGVRLGRGASDAQDILGGLVLGTARPEQPLVGGSAVVVDHPSCLLGVPLPLLYSFQRGGQAYVQTCSGLPKPAGMHATAARRACGCLSFLRMHHYWCMHACDVCERVLSARGQAFVCCRAGVRCRTRV